MCEKDLRLIDPQKSNPFKKVRDFIRGDGSRFQKWEGERYFVILDFFGADISSPYIRTAIKEETSRYTPFVYINTDRDDQPIGVSIQTTSYGALSLEEYDHYLEALKVGRASAQDIDTFFVKPLREKRFELGELID